MRTVAPWGFYEVVPMPAQPQLALCHGLGVPENMRGHGHGHRLKAHQIQHLESQMYDAAICTVRQDNAAQIRVLEHAGYTRAAVFRDRRQGCNVGVWVLVLNAPKDASQCAPA